MRLFGVAWESISPVAGDAFGIGGHGGFPDDQLRNDGHVLGIILFAAKALEQDTRCSYSHAAQGLPDGGEAGVMEGGPLNVVEANNGHVFGHLEVMVAEAADDADGGDVVEGDERREGAFLIEEVLGHRV